MKDPPRPEPELYDTARRPPICEPFNPCREICGFYPLDIVARNTGLTDGKKRLYERAVRWAGRNGRIWYGFDTRTS